MIARISIALFFAMALIYKGCGDYYSVVWSSVFWIGLYFMIASLCWEKYTRAKPKMDEYLYLFSTIYFGFMVIENVICLFGQDLYDKLIINTAAYTFGMIIINVLVVAMIVEFTQIKNIIKKCTSKLKSWLKGL